jgi:hypothetical protein
MKECADKMGVTSRTSDCDPLHALGVQMSSRVPLFTLHRCVTHLQYPDLITLE